LVFSEIIPKTLGVVYWRTLAQPVARGIIILIWFMYPPVWLSEKLTRLLSKREAADNFSREEFAAMVRLGVEEGQQSKKPVIPRVGVARRRGGAQGDTQGNLVFCLNLEFCKQLKSQRCSPKVPGTQKPRRFGCGRVGIETICRLSM